MSNDTKNTGACSLAACRDGAACTQPTFCLAPSMSHEDRLRAANAVDLRDNARIVDAGDGYVRVEPIDPTKRWGA